ncbi:uncharacterized protein [Montipora capricornis]
MSFMQCPELKGLKNHIKGILFGNFTSTRHSLFNNNKRVELLNLSCDCTTYFSSSMTRRLTNELKAVLPEFWPDFKDSNTRMISYLLSVLLPEALVYAVMVKEGCSRQVAERLFTGHQRKANAVDDTDSEDD